MSTPDRKPGVPAYLQPYRDALACHGPSFEATLWKSRRAQRARFRVLTRMIDLRGRTVLDAGCALGDLAEYLAAKRIAVGRYIGIDAFPDIIARAQARGLEHSEFRVADFAADASVFATLARDERVDVIVFSGSLNTFEQPRAVEVVSAAFDAAGVGVVFNFLSSASPVPPPAPDDPARRFDPAALLAWGLSRTPLARCRSDYLHGHDATIALIHSEKRAAEWK